MSAALLSFMPCTACSGSPHNATHSASTGSDQKLEAERPGNKAIATRVRQYVSSFPGTLPEGLII